MKISNSRTLKNEENNLLNFNFLKNEKIDHREYQINIAKKCFGNNSLVVIPTGLGKTIISIIIAAHTLENSPPHSKVVVLAPTRPLINQHHENFLKFMNIPSEKFSILTGQIEPNKRTYEFINNQVLFYTPQTLRNDIINNRYSLMNVCLVIFDEAHRAQGDYAYCQIADEYIEHNNDGIILGLTASPGSNKEKISVLCKNLHIPDSNIFLRTRNDKDVKEYIKPMKIWKVGVDMTDLMRLFSSAFKNMIQERLNYLNSLGFIDSNKEQLENIYKKDLIKLNSNLLQIINGDGSKTGAYKALSVNAQILRLFHMLSLVESQGLDSLLSYLKSMKNQSSKKNASKALISLANNYEINKIFNELRQYNELDELLLIHPKFNICKQIILKELKVNPDTRILIFSKLRDSVATITSKLKKNSLIRPKRFVGQATKSSQDKGLSQKKQIEILNDFKEGKYNVLISTNVAEEGLDIAECDLVIFYDVVASEIRLIQRKGRTARIREGKVFILYCRGTSEEIYLHISLNRLKKMHELLKNPKKIPEIIKQKTKNKHITISQNDNLDSYLSPIVNLSKNIPLFFGIRQFFSASGIKFQVSSNEYHVQIKNQIGIHIFKPRELIQQDARNLFKNFIEKFKKNFKIIVIIVQFLDFTEIFKNEKKYVKRNLLKISQKYEIQIIPIDNKDELFLLLRGFFKKRI